MVVSLFGRLVPSNALGIIGASFCSLLSAATVGAVGVYLGRSRIITREVSKGIATLTLRATMPCLLFTRLLPAMQWTVVSYAWPMIVLPISHVVLGLLLGGMPAPTLPHPTPP